MLRASCRLSPGPAARLASWRLPGNLPPSTARGPPPAFQMVAPTSMLRSMTNASLARTTPSRAWEMAAHATVLLSCARVALRARREVKTKSVACWERRAGFCGAPLLGSLAGGCPATSPSSSGPPSGVPDGGPNVDAALDDEPPWLAPPHRELRRWRPTPPCCFRARASSGDAACSASLVGPSPGVVLRRRGRGRKATLPRGRAARARKSAAKPAEVGIAGIPSLRQLGGGSYISHPALSMGRFPPQDQIFQPRTRSSAPGPKSSARPIFARLIFRPTTQIFRPTTPIFRARSGRGAVSPRWRRRRGLPWPRLRWLLLVRPRRLWTRARGL